jgi:hypothetical protein
VDAWTHKVNPSREMSAIDHLKFLHERCQHERSLAYIVLSDLMLVHKVHSMDQFAVVRVVDLRENVIEQLRTKTIEVQYEFPSFIATCYFLSNVAWQTIKRTGQEVQSIGNSLTMVLPDLPLKNCPVLSGLIIRLGAIKSAAPETYHQIQYVERAKVHDVRPSREW